MAEVNDAELSELRRLQAFHKSLYDDGSVGMDFRKLIKKKYPNAVIPELDALVKAEEIGADLSKKTGETTDAAMKKIDDFLAKEAKKEEDRQVADFEGRINTRAKERGYTEDGTKKLLELMKERNIPNPEDAAVIFEARQPKAKAAPRQFSSRMDFISADDKDDDKFKQLMADPEQYMMDEMMAALQPAEE